MNNIYTEAFQNISCVRELTIDDFVLPALESADVVYGKGAKIYKLYGTKFAVMTHSDQFKSTPNQITWYEVMGVNEDDSRIEFINLIEKEVEDKIPNEMYEEIQFFIKASQRS
jgi:hypothetical protein